MALILIFCRHSWVAPQEPLMVIQPQWSMHEVHIPQSKGVSFASWNDDVVTLIRPVQAAKMLRHST